MEMEGLSLADQLGPGLVDVQRPKRLCNPADKNDEDPPAPTDAEHMIGYEIKQTQPLFTKLFAQPVSNQFGTILVDIVRPELMLLPTAKSLSGSPSPLPPDALNHFKCYRVKRAKFRTTGLVVEDQLGTYLVDIKKPFRLCVPADKNGEGTIEPPDSLMCYKARNFPKRPPITGPIFIDNQFGPMTFFVTRTREFCVPSIYNGP